MPSYNLVNGRPNTVSPDLNAVVRSWTSNELMIVSDAWAPYNLTGSEQYYATQAEADAAAVKAGLDSFTQDDSNPGPMTTAIMAALDQGLLTVADIDAGRSAPADHPFPARGVRPAGPEPVRRDHPGRDQLPGAPATGPPGRGRGRWCC